MHIKLITPIVNERTSKEMMFLTPSKDFRALDIFIGMRAQRHIYCANEQENKH